MSDRALWLEEWCPTCRAAPATRCRVPYVGKTRPPVPLHIARGWRARSCPTCKALPGEPCRTPSGREASRIHQARIRPGRHELLSDESVWQELEARGATIAIVPFSGRARRGGRTERIVLSRLDCDELVDVERRTGRDQLCYALEAPIWDRFGSFAGQPLIVGTVIWTAADRRVVIEGRRGDKCFEELV
ncbi:MAG: zinc finger domain-containing protein [Solirubrobacteraceae bacterium]